MTPLGVEHATSRALAHRDNGGVIRSVTPLGVEHVKWCHYCGYDNPRDPLCDSVRS